MLEVFSSGGGTQSAAIAALIIQGRLPKPDFSVIVDTGREKGSTWDYHDSVIHPELAKVGIELHRVKFADWHAAPEHGMDWLSHNGNTVLLPAFTNQSDSVGKLSGYCSDKWKVRVRDRWLSSQGITRKDFRVWIGFSLDENRRTLRMMKGEEYRNGQIRFPLVEDVPMRRDQSIRLVMEMGWPTPPRSACYMCPNQTDEEWRETKKERPDEFALAARMDHEIRTQDGFVYLHRSCLPLEQVDFEKPKQDPEDDLFTRACNSGGCFT